MDQRLSYKEQVESMLWHDILAQLLKSSATVHGHLSLLSPSCYHLSWLRMAESIGWELLCNPHSQAQYSPCCYAASSSSSWSVIRLHASLGAAMPLQRKSDCIEVQTDARRLSRAQSPQIFRSQHRHGWCGLQHRSPEVVPQLWNCNL